MDRSGAALRAFLSTDARLRFAAPTVEPVVSVVLVLFNRAELTLRCLRSLLECGEIAIEPVIVDNASTDDTARLLDRLEGARIVRSSENRGFLRACNDAVRLARGRYVLFLNNDAELLPGALARLVSTLESSPDVGAVGGRLIAADGRLQEAGGIVWRDGSCSGYGRGDSASAPEYMFAREVHYCSAALLLMRRADVLALDGFDERYAPAYYEDVDLCVRLWKSGRRVVYQPGAAALHVEFASASSKDEPLRLQRERRTIFARTHADWLLQCPDRSLVSSWIARHPAPVRPRVLFIEDRVPHARLGSGYPRASVILHAMVRLGYQVTLYPLVVPDEPWTVAYEDVPATVEIMLGCGASRLVAHLRERLPDYDAVLVSRPHNMGPLRTALASVPHRAWPPLLYDAEALFSRRDIGRRRLQGQIVSRDAEAGAVEAELSLVDRCALVLAVSEEEGVQFAARGVQTLVLGHALQPSPGRASFHHRSGLLFVGRVVDESAPNADALLWLATEILPAVRRCLPGVPATVVGRIDAPRVAQALQRSPDVIVAGMLDDVTSTYDASRLFIAPIRYGAGIPLKVLEAAAHGVPVVCTPLVAQQLGWRDGVDLLVAESPEEFATRCYELYTDEQRWERIRASALRRVEQECDPAAFEQRLGDALARVRRDRVSPGVPLPT